MSHGLSHPFGEVSCEEEVTLLGNQYSNYYFEYVPFNAECTEKDTYLIVGRRGSGKSSLAHYFSFQHKIAKTRCIDVNEPEIYSNVLSRIAEVAAGTSELAIPRIVRIWECVIWSLLFAEYLDEHSQVFKTFSLTRRGTQSYARFILDILKSFLSRFLDDRGPRLLDDFESLLTSPVYEEAKSMVQKLTKEQPVFVAIDSLEHYAIHDESMMRATAALIECGKQFNFRYSNSGIHVKVFIPGEVFPHLIEGFITNPLKYVTNPLHLIWRPKDLIRLICWRLHLFLEHKPHWVRSSAAAGNLNWDKFPEVLRTMWIPYFGQSTATSAKVEEETFPFVLRHTQLRPRQLITLCNGISRRAVSDGTFPQITHESLMMGIQEGQMCLAEEVINSYSKVYPSVGRIVEALAGSPMRFQGKELDRLGHRTASQWSNGDYSPYDFRRIVAELGVVGRVRNANGNHVVEADFEYALRDRLALQVDDDCVIHPMFYKKLNTRLDENMIVYPFPNHPDFANVQQAAA